MESHINLLQTLPTKSEAKKVSETLIEMVNSGECSALEMKVKLKFIEDAIKSTSEGIRDMCVNEAAKYTKGEGISKLGASIESVEAGVQYDYNVCGHPKLAELEIEVSQIKDFLKAIKKPMNFIDETTGEIIVLQPPLRTSTSTVKITLAK